MTYSVTSEHCCGLLDIGEFPDDDLSTTVDLIKRHISECIIEKCVESATDDTDQWRTIDAFMATTRSDYQQTAGLALKALGFRSRKFKSRHTNDAHILFWFRTGIPRELQKEYNEQLKEYNDIR